MSRTLREQLIKLREAWEDFRYEFQSTWDGLYALFLVVVFFAALGTAVYLSIWGGDHGY